MWQQHFESIVLYLLSKERKYLQNKLAENFLEENIFQTLLALVCDSVLLLYILPVQQMHNPTHSVWTQRRHPLKTHSRIVWNI